MTLDTFSWKAGHSLARLRIDALAVRAAEALDRVVAARTSHVLYLGRPDELRPALEAILLARAHAASTIAALAYGLAIRQQAGLLEDMPFGVALGVSLEGLSRFGELVEHGVEAFEYDLQMAACFRRFASRFSRETIQPDGSE